MSETGDVGEGAHEGWRGGGFELHRVRKNDFGVGTYAIHNMPGLRIHNIMYLFMGYAD